MKILSLSPSFFGKVYTTNQNPQTPPASKPIETKPLTPDTVSFSGNYVDDEENICNSFGLLNKTYEDENASYITNFFETHAKENNNEKLAMSKFAWTTKDKNIEFYGNEMDFVNAIKRKKSEKSKVSNFTATSNEKMSLISYDREGVHYDVKYDRKTHDLISAAAEIIKSSPEDAIERMEIRPSRKNENDYVVKYQFIDDRNGERAVEETYILFNNMLQAKASHTEKYFEYSDGEKEEQKFARYYDEEGLPRPASPRAVVPYNW